MDYCWPAYEASIPQSSQVLLVIEGSSRERKLKPLAFELGQGNGEKGRVTEVPHPDNSKGHKATSVFSGPGQAWRIAALNTA